MPDTVRGTVQDEDVARERVLRESFIDLLLGVLDVDPRTRWTPRQTMGHPFITGHPFTGPYQPQPDPPRHPPSFAPPNVHTAAPSPASATSQQQQAAARARRGANAAGGGGPQPPQPVVGSYGGSTQAAAAVAGSYAAPALLMTQPNKAGPQPAAQGQGQAAPGGQVVQLGASYGGPGARGGAGFMQATSSQPSQQRTSSQALLSPSNSGRRGGMGVNTTSPTMPAGLTQAQAAQAHAQAHAIAMQLVNQQQQLANQQQQLASSLPGGLPHSFLAGSLPSPATMHMAAVLSGQQQPGQAANANLLAISAAAVAQQQQQQQFAAGMANARAAAAAAAGGGGPMDTGLPAAIALGSTPSTSFLAQHMAAAAAAAAAAGNQPAGMQAPGPSQHPAGWIIPGGMPVGAQPPSPNSMAQSINSSFLLGQMSPADMQSITFMAMAAARAQAQQAALKQQQQAQQAAADAAAMAPPSAQRMRISYEGSGRAAAAPTSSSSAGTGAGGAPASAGGMGGATAGAGANDGARVSFLPPFPGGPTAAAGLAAQGHAWSMHPPSALGMMPMGSSAGGSSTGLMPFANMHMKGSGALPTSSSDSGAFLVGGRSEGGADASGPGTHPGQQGLGGQQGGATPPAAAAQRAGSAMATDSPGPLGGARSAGNMARSSCGVADPGEWDPLYSDNDLVDCASGGRASGAASRGAGRGGTSSASPHPGPSPRHRQHSGSRGAGSGSGHTVGGAGAMDFESGAVLGVGASAGGAGGSWGGGFNPAAMAAHTHAPGMGVGAAAPWGGAGGIAGSLQQQAAAAATSMGMFNMPHHQQQQQQQQQAHLAQLALAQAVQQQQQQQGAGFSAPFLSGSLSHPQQGFMGGAGHMDSQGMGGMGGGHPPDLQPFVGSLPFSGIGAAPIMHLYQQFLQQQQQGLGHLHGQGQGQG